MKKYLLFIILTASVFILSGNRVYSEQNKIDSLIKKVKLLSDDTAKVNSLNYLATQLADSKPGEALEYVNKALALAKKLSFRAGEEEAYKVSGVIYYYQNNYPKSLDNHLKSLKIAEELGHKKEISRSLHNIGNIYSDQGNYEKALEFYNKSLKLKEELGNKAALPSSYIVIGNIHYHRNDYPNALEFYTKASKIAEEIKNQELLSICLMNIGVVYMDQKNYSEALSILFQSLKIRERVNNRTGVSGCLLNIGNVYLKQKIYDKAILYFNNGLAVSKEINSLDNERLAYEGLASAYSGVNNYKKAYEYYKLFKEYNDSIFNEENSRQLGDLKTQFEVENKEKELEAIARETAIKSEAELQAQKLQRNMFSGGFALVLGLALVSFRGYRQKKNANKLLTSQKAIIEEKNKDILDSITYARFIQQAILPSEAYIAELLPQSFIFYKPKDIIAGDFYFVEEHEGNIFIAAADCTGHGVPGAMVSVVCSNALNRAVKEFDLRDAGKILDKTRALVLETLAKNENNVKDGMDISFCCLNKESLELNWAGANNPLWMIRKNSSELIEIKPDKQPIGQHQDAQPFTSHRVELHKGDIIYLFTDGYPDQFGGEKGKKFMYGKLKELLLSLSNQTMSEQKNVIEESFETWKGKLQQVDDVLVIGIKV